MRQVFVAQNCRERNHEGLGETAQNVGRPSQMWMDMRRARWQKRFPVDFDLRA